jgi:hypothetical protein
LNDDLLAFADDMVFFIKNPKQYKQFIQLFVSRMTQFGIHISADKSHFMKLDSDIKIEEYYIDFKHKVFGISKDKRIGQTYMYLGIPLGPDLSQMINDVHDNCKAKIKFFKMTMKTVGSLSVVLSAFYFHSIMAYEL